MKEEEVLLKLKNKTISARHPKTGQWAKATVVGGRVAQDVWPYPALIACVEFSEDDVQWVPIRDIHLL